MTSLLIALGWIWLVLVGASVVAAAILAAWFWRVGGPIERVMAPISTAAIGAAVWIAVWVFVLWGVS